MIVKEPRGADWSVALDERTVEILEHRRRIGIRRPRGWLVRRMLLLADVTALVAAFLCVEVVLGAGSGERNRFGLWAEMLIFMLMVPGFVVVSKLYGLYERDEERADYSTADDLVGVFHLVTVGTWLALVGGWATGLADPDVSRLALFWALAVLLVTLGRASARAFCRRQIAYLQNTIILGRGRVGQLVAQKFRQHPEYGINVVGFVDEPRDSDETSEQPELLATLEELPDIVRALDVERVVIAFFSARPVGEVLELVRSLEDLNVQVDIVPHLYELFGPSVGIHSVEGLPLVGLPPFRLSRSSQMLKRAMDISFALLGCIVLAAFFALFALLIKLDSRGPVLFRQRRVGFRGEMFTIYKFRTMTADADYRKAEFAALNKHAQAGGDPRMFKIVDDPRTTSVGRFLRRYSLDELPQLMNVLKGNMSLVGPRPLIPEEARFVERWGEKRLTIKPGITGPWQVLGRSRIPFEEMVRLDYLYVTQWSLFNDLKLILRTIPTLWYMRDAY